MLGCRSWSESCLLGCMRAEQLEAVGCGLCFSTTFQSSSSSRSEVAVPVFCVWFRQEKSQQYSSFCSSQILFSFFIWVLPLWFICPWNEAVFMSACSVTKLCKLKRFNAKRHEHNVLLLHWAKKKKKRNQAVKAAWATKRSCEEGWVFPKIFGENMCLYRKFISNKGNLSCLKSHVVGNAIELGKQEQDAQKFLHI